MRTKGQRKRENSDFCGTVSNYQELTLLTLLTCYNIIYEKYELIIPALIS